MLSKLPPWVEYGAFALAMLAGIVNAVGLLGFQHQAISHLSGTATLLGVELLSSPGHVLHLLGVIFSFILGAGLSGALIPGTTLQLGRHYELLLVIEGALLLLALLLLEEGQLAGHYAASAACGLQNALVTTYSGAVVRTTHLTGIFTDLGLMIGAACRGKPLDRRKALLFIVIIGGFVTGGVIGGALFSELAFMTLLVPAVMCAALALLYRFYCYRSN